MKFSWKLLSTFINLEQIPFDKLINKLTLAGIEVEQINSTIDKLDQIIELNITSNRSEICSTISLAKELSIILDIPLKIWPINSTKNLVNERIEKHECKAYSDIMNISAMQIDNINIEFKSTPQWIVDHLKTHEIKSLNILYDINQYIKIKWGQIFYILDETNIDNILHRKTKNLDIKSIISQLQQNSLFKNSKITNKYPKILIFINFQLNKEKQKIDICNTYDLEYYKNAQIDAIQLITTFTQCNISKVYNLYNINQKSNKILKISKDDIDTILGQINQKNYKFLSHKEIINTLKQLKFSPTYNKKLEQFTINIPHNRQHDIKRKIDIIEEIGRIYGFKCFSNKNILNKKIGYISDSSKKIKKIRKTLRDLGLNEVINCCIVDGHKDRKKHIKLHNPLSQEQGELRCNIIENLINNCQNNLKHGNNRIEVFEVGKIFEKGTQNKYIERISLGGLINNDFLIQASWSSKPQAGNILHIKGVIETFIENINAQVNLRDVYKVKSNGTNKYINSIKYLFNEQKIIGIYKDSNQKLIGIIGKLNKTYSKNIGKSNVYIFEIDINQLSQTISSSNHLNHIIRSYSNYPSVTRDISIKVDNVTQLDEIKTSILNTNISLIESIEIFNEYINKELDLKFIGIRITYRAKNRTLNSTDIQYIDEELKKLTNQYK
uniref:phenylalanine--tRNA ligase n=1 Tax=Alsidium seaforthii TaxID=2007182 RepID=A0A1Z1MDJ1_9FLOR|nr:Phenylalanine-tRNA ligase beta subunit [Bryothamnion seaforthii]ARW64036.1 Phenylalanine-tRNA ligase beta subunit [Bryothamnion seaforthii]